MAPRNPSELQRLTEELKELYREFKNLSYPKGYREALLRDIRKIEDTLGLPHKNYNGEEL